MKVVGCQPYAPATFTPGITWYSFLEAESTPGTWISQMSRKKPGDTGFFNIQRSFIIHQFTVHGYQTLGYTLKSMGMTDIWNLDCIQEGRVGEGPSAPFGPDRRVSPLSYCTVEGRQSRSR
jgi:hypothetical protein